MNEPFNGDVAQKLSVIEAVADVIRAWQRKTQAPIPQALEADTPQGAAKTFVDRFQEPRRAWENGQKTAHGSTLDPYLSRVKSASAVFLSLTPAEHAKIAAAASKGLKWRGESMVVFDRTRAMWTWMQAHPDRMDELKLRVRDKMRTLYKQIPR